MVGTKGTVTGQGKNEGGDPSRPSEKEQSRAGLLVWLREHGDNRGFGGILCHSAWTLTVAYGLVSVT